MIKFFLFIKKIHFLLLFILLESLAIHYYANSTSYTKVKLVTASNYVVGGIYSQIAGLNSYFHLRRENQALARNWPSCATGWTVSGFRFRRPIRLPLLPAIPP